MTFLYSERFGALVAEGLQTDEATEGLSILISLDKVSLGEQAERAGVRAATSGRVREPVGHTILIPGLVLKKVAADADVLIMSGVGDAIGLDTWKRLFLLWSA